MTTCASRSAQSLLAAPEVAPEGAYGLRVVGDSMTGDGICDGDFVIIDPGQVPGDGDIAALQISNYRPAGSSKLLQGWLLKRLRRNRDGIVLESSNPAYPPILVRPEHQLITEGRATAVYRITP